MTELQADTIISSLVTLKVIGIIIEASVVILATKAWIHWR